VDPGGGRELSSKPLSELGGNASSSPASGGRDTHVLDCFLFHSAGVFYARKMAFSSNIRFTRTIDEKGHSFKIYLPRAK
jgi:hypothetical protein